MRLGEGCFLLLLLPMLEEDDVGEAADSGGSFVSAFSTLFLDSGDPFSDFLATMSSAGGNLLSAAGEGCGCLVKSGGGASSAMSSQESMMVCVSATLGDWVVDGVGPTEHSVLGSSA